MFLSRETCTAGKQIVLRTHFISQSLFDRKNSKRRRRKKRKRAGIVMFVRQTAHRHSLLLIKHYTMKKTRDNEEKRRDRQQYKERKRPIRNYPSLLVEYTYKYTHVHTHTHTEIVRYTLKILLLSPCFCCLTWFPVLSTVIWYYSKSLLSELIVKTRFGIKE